MNFRGFNYGLLWVSVCWILAEGVRMISPSQPIIAEPGDDVILPCHLDPPLNVEKSVVRWSRPDLQPDPSDQNWVDIVHLYQEGREDLDLKIPSYVNRTELFTEELKHGNVSLKILNVTSGDAGRYRCDVRNLMKYSRVQLVVDPDLKTRTTETPLYSGDLQTPDPTEDKVTDVDQTRHRVWILPLVFCLLVLVVVVDIGVWIKLQRQKQTQKHNDVESDVVLKTPSPDSVL